MVKDLKTGECFRADHLIKNSAEKVMADKKTTDDVKRALTDVLARLDGFDDKDMHEVFSLVSRSYYVADYHQIQFQVSYNRK